MSLYDELGDEVRNKTRNLMQNIQQLRQLIDTFIKNSKTENQATHKFVSDVVNDNPFTNFTFTGKDTDLSYFLQSERMPVSAIRNIADSDIKDAVTNTFVKYDSTGGLRCISAEFFSDIYRKGKRKNK